MENPVTILRGEGRGRGQAGGMELKLDPTGIFVNTLVYVVYSLTPPSAIRGKVHRSPQECVCVCFRPYDGEPPWGPTWEIAAVCSWGLSLSALQVAHGTGWEVALSAVSLTPWHLPCTAFSRYRTGENGLCPQQQEAGHPIGSAVGCHVWGPPPRRWCGHGFPGGTWWGEVIHSKNILLFCNTGWYSKHYRDAGIASSWLC